MGIERAKINQTRATLNAQLARNTLRQTIEKAYLDVVAAAKTFGSNKINWPHLRSVLE